MSEELRIDQALDCPSAWKESSLAYGHFVRREKIGLVHVIVELGVHFGYSLFCFAKDFPEAKVFGIDNFSMGDSERAGTHLRKYLPLFPNATILSGDSIKIGKDWTDPSTFLHIDILHIDSNHEFEHVKKEFEVWSPHVRSGGAILFHDVTSFPEGPGKFFHSLPGEKAVQSNLGVWYKQ